MAHYPKYIKHTLIVSLMLLVGIYAASLRVEDNNYYDLTHPENLSEAKKIMIVKVNNRQRRDSRKCYYREICGWLTYSLPNRKFSSFIFNTCKCDPKDYCVRDNDDLSINSWQYRCSENKTDAIAPTDYVDILHPSEDFDYHV